MGADASTESAERCMSTRKTLPKELQALISWSVELLGRAIKDEYGSATYNQVEKIRQTMKGLRGAPPDKVFDVLLIEKKKTVSVNMDLLVQEI